MRYFSVIPSVFLAASAFLTTHGFAAVPGLADFQADPASVAMIAGDRQMLLLYKPRTIEITTGRNTERIEARFVSSMAVIAAPITAVREAALGFERYPEFLPQTRSAKVVSRGDSSTTVDFELAFQLPVGSTGVKYTLAYTLHPAGHVTWQLVKGDLRENIGRWEFYPLAGDRTLAVYTTWVDLESMSFVLRTMLKAQPDLQVAIPVASAAVVMNAIGRRARGLPPDDPQPKSVAARSPAIPLFSRGGVPGGLATLRELAENGTILFIDPQQWIQTPEGPLDFTFVSAAGLVRAPIDVAHRLTTSFSRYSEFFDQVRDAKQSPKGEGYVVDWRLRLGFGIFSVPINYTIAYIPRADYVLPYHRIQGDMQYIYGAYEWFAVSADETIVLYTTASQLGEKASAILKLGNLIPNRQITIGASSAAIIIEKMLPWIESQTAP